MGLQVPFILWDKQAVGRKGILSLEFLITKSTTGCVNSQSEGYELRPPSQIPWVLLLAPCSIGNARCKVTKPSEERIHDCLLTCQVVPVHLILTGTVVGRRILLASKPILHSNPPKISSLFTLLPLPWVSSNPTPEPHPQVQGSKHDTIYINLDLGQLRVSVTFLPFPGNFFPGDLNSVSHYPTFSE